MRDLDLKMVSMRLDDPYFILKIETRPSSYPDLSFTDTLSSYPNPYATSGISRVKFGNDEVNKILSPPKEQTRW